VVGYPARVRRRRHSSVLVAALALLGAGFGLASCGGGGESAATTTEATATTTEAATATTEGATTTSTGETAPVVVRVVVVGGAPKGGIVRETVQKGDRVRIVVDSDVADEIHLHGYDLSKDVAAGGRATLAFVADVPGRFELELEQRGLQIADLTVNS